MAYIFLLKYTYKFLLHYLLPAVVNRVQKKDFRISCFYFLPEECPKHLTHYHNAFSGFWDIKNEEGSYILSSNRLAYKHSNASFPLTEEIKGYELEGWNTIVFFPVVQFYNIKITLQIWLSSFNRSF